MSEIHDAIVGWIIQWSANRDEAADEQAMSAFVTRMIRDLEIAFPEADHRDIICALADLSNWRARDAEHAAILHVLLDKLRPGETLEQMGRRLDWWENGDIAIPYDLVETEINRH